MSRLVWFSPGLAASRSQASAAAPEVAAKSATATLTTAVSGLDRNG